MKKINYKLAVLCCALLLGSAVPAYSMDYSQMATNQNYYDLGMHSIQNREYSKAIEYLTLALANEPQNSSIRNNLAVAYTSRGTYLYNQNIDLEKAANDFRNAIYYLSYYDRSEDTSTIKQNVQVANANLDNVLVTMQAKTDPVSRLRKAKSLRGKGDLTASVIEYVKASSDKALAYECYVALGDILKTLSNEYNAAVYYDKALALQPTNHYLHLKQGRTLYNLGNIETAVKELDLALDNPKTKDDALALLETIWKERVAKNPKDPIAQMNLGTIYQTKGNLDMALVQYKTAQMLDPKNQMIRLNMATLYQEQGNYTEALNIYNAILKNKPNDVLLNTYKANTLDKMGKKDEALLIYQQLLSANPDNKTIKHAMLNIITSMPDITALNYLSKLAEARPNDEEVIYEYAYTLHKAKRYTEAISEYQKALALNEKNLDAYLNIASIYKQTKNNAKAIETLKQAKLIFPNDEKISQGLTELQEEQAFALMEKATQLYNKKDYNDAIITYKSIPNPTEDVFLGIGACYQAMERYDDAILYYNKAMKLDSSNPNTYYFIGLAYFYKKDYVNADSFLKKALQLDSINPDITDAMNAVKFARSEEVMNAGVDLLDKDKTDEAIARFNSAIAMCKENGYAYYYRGLAYDTKGLNEKAIQDYQKAVSLTPELTMAYYSMALSYDALNNKAEAKKMYQKFITLNQQEDEYTKYAKERLSEL